jgi:hypothetical protein
MNRVWYVARAVLLGLLTTQVLATIHVYLSDGDLCRTITSLSQAGYLTIPNQRIAPSLKEFGPAFWGGLFFTLSLGAGLSVLSVVLAWIWDRLLKRSKALLTPIVLLWLCAVIAVNSQGFSPLPASYFLLPPLAVFVCALKWMPAEPEKRVWLNRVTPLLPIALLTVIWTAHADRLLFLDIRDFLLLSNPVGQKVDRFYYRYTLYPAETFKTLNQKTLKACRVRQVEDKATSRRMESVLINYDYLPVAPQVSDGSIDLEIMQSGDTLDLIHKGKAVLQTTSEEFFSNPTKALERFSMEADRHALFRLATIVCLLIGFPVLLYVMVYALVHFVSGFFVDQKVSAAIAAVLCFLIGLALLAPLRVGRLETVDGIDLSEAWNSESWQDRVVALRSVVSNRLEIGNFAGYRKMISSPHLPVRYWLAKAFGVSGRPETYEALLRLLDDPHPNVVSMAFHSLGQRGAKRAVKEILARIVTSDHWYNQWYAYKALRALGWRQRKGNETSDSERRVFSSS